MLSEGRELGLRPEGFAAKQTKSFSRGTKVVRLNTSEDGKHFTRVLDSMEPLATLKLRRRRPERRVPCTSLPFCAPERVELADGRVLVVALAPGLDGFRVAELTFSLAV